MKIEEWPNLGKILSGDYPDGWGRSILSAHPKIYTKDEADGIKFMFEELEEEDKLLVLDEFSQFFNWITPGCVLMTISEPLPIKGCEGYFEILFDIDSSCLDGLQQAKNFLYEAHLPVIFNPQKKIFAILSYDMTITIISAGGVDIPIVFKRIHFFDVS